MSSSALQILVFAGIILIALLTIGIIVSRLYQRASKEMSFVRTGFGGQKVIMNGGALVLPVLHEIIAVNMNTLRLPVRRADDQALITRDRMRVDVVAEFYVRVQPTADSIANAAQTLGSRTMRPSELKDLIEGKFVDALRSVASEMSMEELHEQRVSFVQKVQQVVSEDLLKNGLELESVSLTGLDQTSMEYFNPNNAFDAEGLTRLTQEIESRKKIRNDIEQDTGVQIQNKNLEAAKLKFDLSKEEEYARLHQEREVEVRRAQQAAEIAVEQSEKRKDAERARIEAEQQIRQSEITSERAVEEERIAKERVIETQDIEKQKTVRIASQDREIAIAEKSKEESLSRATADEARAKAVEAEEKVVSAREREIAERQKQIELIEAAKEAERDAISLKVVAEAQKVAAADNAEAVREEARGEADRVTISANADAEAEKTRAAASEIRYAVEATGNRALNEAANLLSNDQISMKIKLSLIENLENIIRESAKPMENIDGIKIIQVDGLTSAPAGGSNGHANGGSGGNLSDQVVNSALRYRAQAPLLDSLLKEVGLDGHDINGLTNAVDDLISAPKASLQEDGPTEEDIEQAAIADRANKAAKAPKANGAETREAIGEKPKSDSKNKKS
ncbi:inner membrane protein YqiK [Maritalea myrionectae]|uniref:Inner membrane protein YqiK n=1 Tax=Maritalea myrionectae TaxID=454601 RepID=A0A2R4MIR1_9HYPH|nr:flotillin family protein [Maritalea myrionectae]AVX05907.1 inner membrane protein YqiK [Maritalea myrionectae]